MKNYHVIIQGNNFLIKSVGDLEQKCGFKTGRYVSSENKEEAEQKAIALMRDEPFLTRSVLNKKSDPPLLYVINVNEVKKVKKNPMATAIQFFMEDNVNLEDDSKNEK